jgi:flagellar basal-body rod protein FlgB
MSNSMISNDALQAAKLALNGLTKRQEVISNNLANVDTPGYQAKRLDFESTLKSELKRSQNIDLQGTQQGHLSPSSRSRQLMRILDRQGGTPRADGNNVDIDQEMLEMQETSLRFQTLSSLLSKKYNLLKEITKR